MVLLIYMFDSSLRTNSVVIKRESAARDGSRNFSIAPFN